MIDSDGVSKLAYGIHPEINPADLTNTPPYADQAGPLMGGIVSGNRIRIVFDELLRAGNLEQFACACFLHPTPPFPQGTPPGCTTRGFAFGANQVDVNQCVTCGNDEATPQPETARCADYNFDGVPDDAFLVGDTDTDGDGLENTSIVVITCEGVNIPIQVTQGWYNPSGNQLIPTALGTNALGPAITINPAVLRSNSMCTVTLGPEVVDKDGNAVEGFPGAVFPTAPMSCDPALLLPADMATGVPVDTVISVTLDAALNPATAALTVSDGTTTVTGMAVVDPADPTTIVFTPDAPLAPATVYTVTVPTTVTDAFGGAAAATTCMFSFTTA